jgi:hypothetical protein
MVENINNKNTVNNPSGDGGKTYWNKWYVTVVLFLIAQIIIFYWITKSFS